MVDQYKTQVMFLHPEPSLMEPCARLLGENFSVHMAASGTEALTTLGITPIHIIVSAQDLPGMTGQEALKEAKRRSPETRGILLASPEMTDSDRASLVNVKHLNLVLGPLASAEEVCAAIQHALSDDGSGSMQPANDTSAGPRSQARPSPSPATAPGDVSGPYDLLAEDIPVLEPGAANDARPAAQSLSEVEIVVLTNDGSFLKTIRAATGASHVVNHAPNLQAAIDVVRDGQSGVLITDAAVAVRDVETITAKLRKYMPSLVTIVAGRREDGEKMMGLISDGLVYRFLLKPISPGRTRLAIEASAKKHLTLAHTEVPLTPNDVQEKMTETGIIKGVTFDSGLFRTTDVRPTTVAVPEIDEEDVDGGLIERLFAAFGPMPLIIGAVVLVTALGFFLFGGSDDPATDGGATAATQPAATLPAAPPPTPAERAATLAARGERALRDGRLTQPADDNAVVHFAQAAALVRDDAALRAQLESVLQQAFAQIESSLLADRISEASAALAVLNDTVPGHPRLAFYNRQVSREIARQDLERAETALLSGDTAAAENAIARLERNGVTDPAIVTALRDRLAAVPAAGATVAAAPTSVDDLLEFAALRVSEGRLIEPTDDSARDYYQAVIELEPDNVTARQGLTFVASMLISESRSTAARGELAQAERLLDEAVATGANRVEATALRGEIDTLAQSAAANAARAVVGTPAQESTEAPANTAEDTTAPPPPPASIGTGGFGERTTTPVREVPVREPSVAKSTPVTQPGSGKPANADVLMPEAGEFDLVQTRAVPPGYPRAAQRRGIEGWVDVAFSVRADGTTSDVTVVESQPGTVFDDAATEAVSKWRYEPLDTDDPNAFARARIRLEFNLSN
ncbi:MAG: TonB family protein [Pseudomonadota bacterium]